MFSNEAFCSHSGNSDQIKVAVEAIRTSVLRYTPTVAIGLGAKKRWARAQALELLESDEVQHRNTWLETYKALYDILFAPFYKADILSNPPTQFKVILRLFSLEGQEGYPTYLELRKIEGEKKYGKYLDYNKVERKCPIARAIRAIQQELSNYRPTLSVGLGAKKRRATEAALEYLSRSRQTPDGMYKELYDMLFEPFYKADILSYPSTRFSRILQRFILTTIEDCPAYEAKYREALGAVRAKEKAKPKSCAFFSDWGLSPAERRERRVRRQQGACGQAPAKNR